MSKRSILVTVLASLTAAALTGTLAGCLEPEDTGVATPSPGQQGLACDKASLHTKAAGKLTIGTGERLSRPWFVDDKPENGQGFEAAVAYAVAQRLGFAAPEVTWIRVPTEQFTTAGPKPFDLAVNQLAATEAQKVNVDFSGPYYLMRQAVVVSKTSPLAKATSLAALRRARLGAVTGTAGEQGVALLIKPDAKPQAYGTVTEAAAALGARRVDGLVVDLAAAFALVGGERKDAVIVGQLPQVGVPTQFALLMEKGSPLTGCLTQAVDQLRDAGTFAGLERTWLGPKAGVRDLT